MGIQTLYRNVHLIELSPKLAITLLIIFFKGISLFFLICTTFISECEYAFEYL